ncbi:MAG: winged helix DNA-binding domain-containing protein [Actinobacteria bacterium]|nr:winged helix DNA-binding domain-containing protein [Actinomycetota bacterium]
MNSKHMARWRMHNLGLSGSRFKTPQEVVKWLCAVQSQDYGPAKWSIAERAPGVGNTAMDRAFNDGTILRTHVLRPTWHFVLPADIRWMLQATGHRINALNAYMYRQEELDNLVLAKSDKLLVDILQEGNFLTRKQLAEAFKSAGIVATHFRLAYILMHAELNGTICSGPLNGKQHTYALIDERAPQTKDLTSDEALAELTLRYFTSHGPATMKDFKSWSSLTVADIRKGLEMVGSRFEHEVIDDLSYWFAESAHYPEAATPTVHLLQAYDEYIMGYSESRPVLDVSRVTELPRQGNHTFNHVIVLDSQLAGHWKRTLKKNSLIIEAVLYTPFCDAQTEALQAAADKQGEFLGLTTKPVVARAI